MNFDLNNDAMEDKPQNNTIYFFSGLGLTIVVSVMIFVFLLLPRYQEVTNNLEVKNSKIESLMVDLVSKNKEVVDLEEKLLAAQESIVILQREMTTFGEYDNTDNLLNSNSMFETLQIINLKESPGLASVATHKIVKDTPGEIIDGPRLVDGSVWWKVSFKDEEEGWVDEILLKRVPSIVLRIDADSDGITDSTIRFVGDYDPRGFVVEAADGNTIIRYKGEIISEPYKVTNL